MTEPLRRSNEQLTSAVSDESRSPGRSNSMPHHVAILGITIVWGVLVVFGLTGLWVYATRPGASGKIAQRWPSASTQKWDEHRPTLLVFAHPRCPCTRATIDELSWIMTRCNERVTCRIYFMQPETESIEWAKTSTWKAASAIPGVDVYFDADNQEADAFGAETSGHAMLFDQRGRLMFQGGITPSRGHRGDNDGCDRIVALVRDEARPKEVPVRATSEEVPATDVFGCPLSNRSADSLRVTVAAESRES